MCPNKTSCAILISFPLAYGFYTFFKYTATYSSFLKTWQHLQCRDWTCSSRELVSQVRHLLYSGHLPHFSQLARCVEE